MAKTPDLESLLKAIRDMEAPEPFSDASLLRQAMLDNDRLEARIAALEAHVEGIRKILRSECADLGDNNWPDNLHLGDVIEKHLCRPVRAAMERLEAENAALREERAKGIQQTSLAVSLRALLEDRQRIRRELLAAVEACSDEVDVDGEGIVSFVTKEPFLDALDRICPEEK